MTLNYKKLHEDNPANVEHIQQLLRELYEQKRFTDQRKPIRSWKEIQRAAGLGDIAEETFRNFVSDLKRPRRLGGARHAVNFAKLVDYLRRENLLSRRTKERREEERRKSDRRGEREQFGADALQMSPISDSTLIAQARGVYMFWRITTQQEGKFVFGALEIKEEGKVLRTTELVRFNSKKSGDSNSFQRDSEEIHRGVFFEKAGVRVILSFAEKSKIPRITYFVKPPDDTSVGEVGWKSMSGVVVGVSKRHGRAFATPCYFLRASEGETLETLRPRLDLVEEKGVYPDALKSFVVEGPSNDYEPIIF